MFKHKYQILIFFLISSVISIYIPVFKEYIIKGGADFQWSPSKLLFEGTNHYEFMLIETGEKIREKIILSQMGEYLHGLYVLFYPFTIFDWEFAKYIWLILNIYFLVAIPTMLCNHSGISNFLKLIIIFTFIISTVSKINIIMGQQTLLILFFITLNYIKSSKTNQILVGISYFKYTLGYVLFFDFLFSKKFNILFKSLIPSVIGWLLYSWISKSSPFLTLFQPFQLAIENHSNYESGLLNRLYFLSPIENINVLGFKITSVVSLIASILISIVCVYKVSKIKNNDLLKVSTLLLLPLIFLPNYGHNYILVLPLLVYSVKNFKLKSAKFSILASVYMLFFYRGFEIYSIKFLNFFELSSLNISIINFFIVYFKIVLLTGVFLINIYRRY